MNTWDWVLLVCAAAGLVGLAARAAVERLEEAWMAAISASWDTVEMVTKADVERHAKAVMPMAKRFEWRGLFRPTLVVHVGWFWWALHRLCHCLRWGEKLLEGDWRDYGAAGVELSVKVEV